MHAERVNGWGIRGEGKVDCFGKYQSIRVGVLLLGLGGSNERRMGAIARGLDVDERLGMYERTGSGVLSEIVS